MMTKKFWNITGTTILLAVFLLPAVAFTAGWTAFVKVEEIQTNSNKDLLWIKVTPPVDNINNCGTNPTQVWFAMESYSTMNTAKENLMLATVAKMTGREIKIYSTGCATIVPGYNNVVGISLK